MADGNMIQKFDEFVREIDDAYARVRDALHKQRYTDATRVMTEITKRQSATSVGMRSAFQKAGVLKSER
jgi:Mg2+ and Co2+ transporter CorA